MLIAIPWGRGGDEMTMNFKWTVLNSNKKHYSYLGFLQRITFIPWLCFFCTFPFTDLQRLIAFLYVIRQANTGVKTRTKHPYSETLFSHFITTPPCSSTGCFWIFRYLNSATFIGLLHPLMEQEPPPSLRLIQKNGYHPISWESNCHQGN